MSHIIAASRGFLRPFEATHAETGGRYTDGHVMSILRDEWHGQRS